MIGGHLLRKALDKLLQVLFGLHPNRFDVYDYEVSKNV